MTADDVIQLGRKVTDALQAVADANRRGWAGAFADDEGRLGVAIAELLERVGYLASQTMDPAPDSAEAVDGEQRLAYTLTEAGRAALAEGLDARPDKSDMYKAWLACCDQWGAESPPALGCLLAIGRDEDGRR